MSAPDLRAAISKSAPIERHKRLSQSLVWRLLRNFYTGSGIHAWSKSRVPLHITSNTFIARAYAKTIEGFLRDYAGRLDPAQPVYVFELGAGSGRFSFLLVKALLEIVSQAGMPEIRYVLTDLAASNLEYWESHPRLLPFFEMGVLDTAVVDLSDLRNTTLRHSAVTLAPGTFANPIVAIANYVFDSVPQDAFLMADGRLHENLITLATGRAEPDLESPEMLSRIRPAFTAHPAEPEYYEDPHWNALLEDARRRLPSAAFLFPVAALQCVRALNEISGGKCLLISADKGYNRDESLMAGYGVPGMVHHADGCFSMMVDYRIIGDYVRRLGGVSLHPSHPHESLNVSAFVLGGASALTSRAFEDAIERFGPDDFFTLVPVLEAGAAAMTFEQTIAALRLACMDFRLLWTFLPVWKAQAAELTPVRKRELASVILKAWDLYYSIGEEEDLAFELGVLFLELGLYNEALEFLAHSEAHHGLEAGTAYNKGVCHLHRREKEKAMEQVEIALALDPEFDAAKALRIRVESCL